VYVKSAKIENSGPISRFTIDFKFRDDGSPCAVVIVGKNGSGKSIFLAHILNGIFDAQQSIYENPETKKGNVYKIRGGEFIRYNSLYSYSKISFTSQFIVEEMVLRSNKKEWEDLFKICPPNKIYTEIPEHENSIYKSSFLRRRRQVEEDFDRNTYLYFPPNRFEQPNWLNEQGVERKADYQEFHNTINFTNKTIIAHSPMKDNQSWLLDIIFDAHALDETLGPRLASEIGDRDLSNINVKNKAHALSIVIETILKIVFMKDGEFLWHIGNRGRRSIGFSINGEVITHNLFGLSTGQIAILNMFISIVRDADISIGEIKSIKDISGIVIIDEIDVHLHLHHQVNILPHLIRIFRNIQFIITTHSPFFLLGMQNVLGNDIFDILKMPEGESIQVEDFAELRYAFDAMRRTGVYESGVKEEIAKSTRPVLFVEGITDVSYIKFAASKLDRGHVLDKFEIREANGLGGLTKLWRSYDERIAEIIPLQIFLIYDCDAGVECSQKGRVIRYTWVEKDKKIKRGIENLLSERIVALLKGAQPSYVDVLGAHKKVVSGVEMQVSEEWVINKSRKREAMEWVLANSRSEDFSEFVPMFDFLESKLVH